MDPDPRIHTTELRIRMLFSSLPSNLDNKVFLSFFACSFLLKVHLRQSKKIKSRKEVTRQ